MALFHHTDLEWFELKVLFADGSESTMRFEADKAIELLSIHKNVRAMERLTGKKATSFRLDATIKD